jgi:hypothetical protein
MHELFWHRVETRTVVHGACPCFAAPPGPPAIELELEESDDILEGVAVAAKTKILLSYLHDVVARLEV